MRTAVKKNARRQELLEQIYPMIDQVGYENLTVRGICTSLGISTGTFYHYFPEKADLLLAFFAGIDDFYQQEVLPRFGPDEAANLDRFIHSYGVYCQRVGAGGLPLFDQRPRPRRQTQLSFREPAHQPDSGGAADPGRGQRPVHLPLPAGAVRPHGDGLGAGPRLRLGQAGRRIRSDPRAGRLRPAAAHRPGLPALSCIPFPVCKTPSAFERAEGVFSFYVSRSRCACKIRRSARRAGRRPRGERPARGG